MWCEKRNDRQLKRRLDINIKKTVLGDVKSWARLILASLSCAYFLIAVGCANNKNASTQLDAEINKMTAQ
jgi:hypothetical protein